MDHAELAAAVDRIARPQGSFLLRSGITSISLLTRTELDAAHTAG